MSSKKARCKKVFLEKASLQGSNNAAIIADLETITKASFINKELFKGTRSNHKFTIGQRCELIELENYPEFNGEEVKITAIRKDGQYGKAYYFKPDNLIVATQLNWTYEYRLKSKDKGGQS